MVSEVYTAQYCTECVTQDHRVNYFLVDFYLQLAAHKENMTQGEHVSDSIIQ